MSSAPYLPASQDRTHLLGASGFAALTARNQAEVEARMLCAPLTDKQKEVLQLVCKGLQMNEVAQHLGCSRSAVEQRRQTGLQVMGVGSTVEAAVLLTRAGLV
jgi:DNA-binding NarL/FixJ family response regulator